MQLQRVNNQPSFNAKLQITTSETRDLAAVKQQLARLLENNEYSLAPGERLKSFKPSAKKENRISKQNISDLAKIAKSIGSELDEIVLEIGPILTTAFSEDLFIKYYMINGAIKRVGQPLAILKAGSMSWNDKMLKSPFAVIQEVLLGLKTPSAKVPLFTPKTS